MTRALIAEVDRLRAELAEAVEALYVLANEPTGEYAPDDPEGPKLLAAVLRKHAPPYGPGGVMEGGERGE